MTETNGRVVGGLGIIQDERFSMTSPATTPSSAVANVTVHACGICTNAWSKIAVHWPAGHFTVCLIRSISTSFDAQFCGQGPKDILIIGDDISSIIHET